MSQADELPIVIVGGGFSGTLLAINLVRLGASVLLIERREADLAKGLAFGTRRSEHLLNVRASNMSAFPDDPGHFMRWMGFSGEDQANRFVPRLAYGQYLRELLIKAMADNGQRLIVRAGHAIDVRRQSGGYVVEMEDGTCMAGAAVVLALGNLLARLPLVLGGLPQAVAVADPWSTVATEGLGADDPVLLVGTGLTAIDVILSLSKAGHRGPVIALSRRGLRPRAHAHAGPSVKSVPLPNARGSWLVRAVRKRAATEGWRAAVDELRPHAKALWQAHDRAAQARFLRHLRAWWDVHRHRLAPSIDERVAAKERAGQVAFRAGRLLSASMRGDRVEIGWMPRGTSTVARLSVARVINCTGPEGNITQCREPLLRLLLDRGMVRSDAHCLGLEVSADCRVIDASGNATSGLFAVGPLTKGAAWEIVAVPDIRQQVWGLARDLTGRS